MKIHSGHYILVCFALITVVAASFGYYVLYKQVVAQARSSSQAIQSVGREAERKQEETQLLKLYSETEKNRSKILSSFVEEERVVGFIEEVEAIGSSTATSLELSGLSKGEGQINAYIDIEGSWSGVMRALTLIENLPYSVSIRGIGLTSTEKLWNLTFNFSVLTL